MAKKETKAPEKQEYVSKYTISELAEAAHAFGTDKIIVFAALKKAGQESYTMEEAEKIITKFKTKEVKY